MFKKIEFWILLFNCFFLSFLPMTQAVLWQEVIPESWKQIDGFLIHWRLAVMGVGLTAVGFGILVPAARLEKYSCGSKF